MAGRITGINAYEILDSRGEPTILTNCVLDDGTKTWASVPSGRSTGRWEAHEKRDRDPSRFDGLGCRLAIAGINGEVQAAVKGMPASAQIELDQRLIELDGTPTRERLGANAMLSVSLAVCRAAAKSQSLELWQWLAALAGNESPTTPGLTVNLFSGGKHAGQQVPVQDVLLVPGAATTQEALAMVRKVFSAAVELCATSYGTRPLTADEGGLAPPFESTEAMFELAVQAVRDSGLGREVDLAVDVAASHFASDGSYEFEGRLLDGEQMIRQIEDWLRRYPIVSVEDGLDQDAWKQWGLLNAAIGRSALVVGDDLLCTQVARIERAIAERAANALILKPNQVGTVSEALEAREAARDAGMAVVASARSGETEDSWLADLAVGWSADFIKVGSITQSDRLSKYNRLLVIEAQHGPQLSRGETNSVARARGRD